MKIGILTLPLHTNYGGILQAYALQTVLERMGHEVVVFDKKREFKLPCKPVLYARYLKRIAKKLLIDPNTVIFFENKYKKEYPIFSQHTWNFIETYIHLQTVNKLKELDNNEYDCIVVGSDQVWRPLYFRRMWSTDMSDAFLRFTKEWDIIRIAYAASLGVDEWEFTPEETAICKEMARIFKGISVREDSALELCKNNLSVEVNHVLDPTLLLNKEDYINLFEKAQTPKSSGNFFNYILDTTPDKIGLTNRIARERGLNPFQGNYEYTGKEKFIQPPVESWLRAFYDAELILTDSFHACVFSIIFGKPFLAIGNKNRGYSRFVSLLSMFELEDHLLSDVSEYNPEKSYEIGQDVQTRLEQLITISRSFLETNLT